MTRQPAADDRPLERVLLVLESRRRLVLLVLVLLTLFFLVGLVVGDGGVTLTTFEVDSSERAAAERVTERFGDEQAVTQVVVQSSNETISKPVLLETLAFQSAVRSNETINRTLATEQPTVGVGNGVAVASDPRLGFFGTASLEAKANAIAGRTDDQLEDALARTLEDDAFTPEGQPPMSTLVPTNYEPGASGQDATTQRLIIVHDADASDEELLTAQQEIEVLADEHVSGETFVVGEALLFERGAQATAESFIIVGPLVVLVVVAFLFVAYRNFVDVTLSCVGIGAVLVWLGGTIGWLGLSVNQLLVAVPCLIVGLGIDYQLHVLMRYREQRATLPSLTTERAMTYALSGVLLAIGTTTLTTGIAFLTGLHSPIAILQTFGLVAALGIGFAAIVFGVFIPLLKLEVESRREQRRGNTRPSPVSVGTSRLGTWLAHRSTHVAIGFPVIIVALAVVLTAGGVLGLATVEPSSDRADFLPDERPAWMAQLPAEIRPDEYGQRAQAHMLESTFDGPPDQRVFVLVEGDVTANGTVETIDEAEAMARELPGQSGAERNETTVTGPAETIDAIAATNETVADLVSARDTSGDGLPDHDLETVFDALFEADPARANETIYRSDDGEYEAVLLTVPVDETDHTQLSADTQAIAAVVSTQDELTAIATGGPILETIDDRAILETILETFAVTLVVVGVLVLVLYRLRHRSWWLGIVTVVPVLCAIGWLIGTMAVLSIPYTAETALSTAIAIGLGTDYTIHLSERFVHERRRRTSTEALEVTLRETGTTVFVSAVTTAAAFALLLLTLVPSLQRFGFVTALVVWYAFLASVLVLPSLLVLLESVLDLEGDHDQSSSG